MAVFLNANFQDWNGFSVSRGGIDKLLALSKFKSLPHGTINIHPRSFTAPSVGTRMERAVSARSQHSVELVSSRAPLPYSDHVESACTCDMRVYVVYSAPWKSSK